MVLRYLFQNVIFYYDQSVSVGFSDLYLGNVLYIVTLGLTGSLDSRDHIVFLWLHFDVGLFLGYRLKWMDFWECSSLLCS